MPRKIIAPATDFRIWLNRMGFNAKQVAMGAELIGMAGRGTASATAAGKRQLTETERLAMTAARLGLKPWTPEYDDELQVMELVNAPSNAA